MQGHLDGAPDPQHGAATGSAAPGAPRGAADGRWVDDEAIAEFEGDTTFDRQTGRTIDRVDVVDAPAYVEPAERYSGANILDDPRLKLRTALVELRRLDAQVKRLTRHDIHDGFDSAQDEATDRANEQAREALRLALTLFGIAQHS